MRFLAFSAFFALALALATPLQAQRAGDGETLDRILPDIRAAHPGRLSDAQPWIDESGRTHYLIKWMTPEGRILFFDADARSGRFSNWDGEPRPLHPHVVGADGSRPPETDEHVRSEEHARPRANLNDGTGPFGGESNAPRGGRDWHGAGDWHGPRGNNGGFFRHGRGGN